MALAHGYALPFEALRRTGVLAQNTADATIRATADGATKEAAGSCLDARALEVQQRTVVQPSILVVPQLTRNGVVLTQLPDTRTNFIQNNTMTGATGSVAPTTWSVVAPPIGITIGYSASGQTTAADGTLVDYIDVTVSGTALTSGNFNLRPEPVTSTVSGNLLFAAGMTYTASFYMSLLSGSVSGVSPNYQIQEVSGTTFVAGTSLDLSAITSNLTRYSLTRTLVGTGGADRIRTRYGHAIASGQVLNYTIRIASPQLEKGSVATPVIRTASGFVSVDMLGVARDGAPPDFTFTRATTATRVNASGLIESVASGVLRLDYPVTGGCPAALIEPAATNLAWHSQTWATGTNWLLFNTTTATGTSGTIDPLGTNTANAISPTSANGTHSVVSNNSTAITFTSGTIYTQSGFFKQGTGSAGRYVQLTFSGSRFTQAGYANFDLQTGALVASGGTADTNRAASIENYGNGWYRCRFTATCDNGGTGAGTNYVLITASGDVRAASFTGVTGDVLYGWGAQLETGAIPTSYIPTTAASATRTADVCSVSGVSGYIGQTEGTIYAEVDMRNFASSAARRIVNMRVDGNNLLSLEINSAGTSIEFVATSGGVAVTTTASGLTSGIQKIAVGYNSAASGTALYVNGTLRDTKTIAIPSLASVVFGLGVRADGGAGTQLNDRLRAAAIYTTRLSNDQLANITRLT